MRIKDLDEGVLDSFKQGFNKGLGKNAFTPKKRETPLARLNPAELKRVLRTIIKGEQLDAAQLAYLQSIYNQI